MTRKVSPERIFRSHFPMATLEKQRPAGYGNPYYLVRRQLGAQMWSGCGDTRAKAWADACDRCRLTAIKEPDTSTATERSIAAEEDRADREYDRMVDDKITG